MNDANIFRLGGLIFIFIGIGMSVSRRYYREMINEMIASKGEIMITSILSLVTGYLFIIFHNFWEWGWTLLITIFGWLMFARGILLLVIPAVTVRYFIKVIEPTKSMNLISFILFVFGIFFFILSYFI